MSKRQLSQLSAIFFIIAISSGCAALEGSSKRLSKEDIQKHEIYAIRNVNIIPMTSENKIIGNATVVVGNKKILSINQPIPGKAKIIDGKG